MRPSNWCMHRRGTLNLWAAAPCRRPREALLRTPRARWWPASPLRSLRIVRAPSFRPVLPQAEFRPVCRGSLRLKAPLKDPPRRTQASAFRQGPYKPAPAARSPAQRSAKAYPPAFFAAFHPLCCAFRPAFCRYPRVYRQADAPRCGVSAPYAARFQGRMF